MENKLKPDLRPLSKWSFFTCSDHVKQLSENNFQRKITEISKITEKNIPEKCRQISIKRSLLGQR